jgi:hypothetical protein
MPIVKHSRRCAPIAITTAALLFSFAVAGCSAASKPDAGANVATPAAGASDAANGATRAQVLPSGGKVARILLPPVIATSVRVNAQVAATAVDAAGAIVTGAKGIQISWAVADTSIARIDSSGMVTPLHAGFTTVTASYKGVESKAVISVRGPVDIPTRSRNVGINLNGLAYYGTNFPFCDLMKSGSGWWSINADGSWTKPFTTTSPRGEPLLLALGQRAVAAVAWTDAHYPAGQYTILWEGEGTISFPLTNATIKEKAPHRIVMEPNDLAGQIFVGIEATDPKNPVRNVRFLLPGTEKTCAAQRFNPEYLKRIAPFSVLRMMDWGATNGSPIVDWADRPHVEDASYTTPRGVPIEVMIDLANTLHADPWFNVPAMASDDYVRKFAALLHERLDPTLRPRIEYSNEMWNWSFPQIQWGIKQSKAQGLPLPWGMPSIYHAKRSVEIFKLMRTEFGPDAGRLVRILAGQAVWAQFLENGLAYGDTAKNIDTISIAPYFNASAAADPKNVAVSRTLSPDQIVDQMFVNIRGPFKEHLAANAKLAAKYNVGLTAYEGGAGDDTKNFPEPDQKAMTELFSAAYRNPRMKELYDEYFTIWTEHGGETMNQFTDIGAWSKWGFWGLLEYVTQAVDTSPRYQGILKFINAHPSPTRFSLSAPP